MPNSGHLLVRFIFEAGFGGSILYAIVQMLLILKFRNRTEKPDRAATANVSILRPLAGTPDFRTLRSACQQTFIPAEILYGIDDDTDMAALSELHKHYPVPMVLCREALPTAVNRKIGKLAVLEEKAAGEILIAVDQDIFLPPDHLKKILSYFADPAVGMVTSLYCLSDSKTIGDELERLSVHSDFFPSVLVAEMLEGRLRFAFGAMMAFRRDVLRKIGGFRSVEGYLADDYQLGVRIHQAGYRVVLSSSIVTHEPGRLSLSDYWARAVRAARTHRVNRPIGYAFSLFTEPLPWAAGLFFAGSAALGVRAAILGLFIRGLTLFLSDRTLAGKKSSLRSLFLLPVYEMLRFFLWISAFTGNAVRWRGQRYRVQSDGKMQPISKDR